MEKPAPANPEPVYHLLVIGDGTREAYDRQGRRVDERTGVLLESDPVTPPISEEPRPSKRRA